MSRNASLSNARSYVFFYYLGSILWGISTVFHESHLNSFYISIPLLYLLIHIKYDTSFINLLHYSLFYIMLLLCWLFSLQTRASWTLTVAWCFPCYSSTIRRRSSGDSTLRNFLWWNSRGLLKRPLCAVPGTSSSISNRWYRGGRLSWEKVAFWPETPWYSASSEQIRFTRDSEPPRPSPFMRAWMAGSKNYSFTCFAVETFCRFCLTVHNY